MIKINTVLSSNEYNLVKSEYGLVEGQNGTSSIIVKGPDTPPCGEATVDLLNAIMDIFSKGTSPGIVIHFHKKNKPHVCETPATVSDGDINMHINWNSALITDGYAPLYNSIMIFPNNSTWYNFYNSNGQVMSVPKWVINEIVLKKGD